MLQNVPVIDSTFSFSERDDVRVRQYQPIKSSIDEQKCSASRIGRFALAHTATPPHSLTSICSERVANRNIQLIVQRSLVQTVITPSGHEFAEFYSPEFHCFPPPSA